MVSWDQQRAEILRHFRALVQIDTSNPPGNEIKVVEYLNRVLDSEGIPSRSFALDPIRPNLVARLTGNGSKRPLLLLAHTDVVGVQREKWPVDPFGAVAKDGYIWGRGTTDDKDKLTAMLMTLLLAERSGATLDRDLIFLAESGEEADPTGVGIRFMADRHFDEIDAEFAITEGPGQVFDNERVSIVQIATTEKVPRRVRLVASGTSGHGSVPEMAKVISDAAVKIVPLPATRPAAPASRTDSAMYRALEQAGLRMYPGAAVLPVIMTGATDMAQLRAKGIQSYGIGPAMTSDDFVQHAWHSDVERLREASLYDFVEFTWTAVGEAAFGK